MHLIKMQKSKEYHVVTRKTAGILNKYSRWNHDNVFACNNYNVQTCSQLDEILISKLYNKGDKLKKNKLVCAFVFLFLPSRCLTGVDFKLTFRLLFSLREYVIWISMWSKLPIHYDMQWRLFKIMFSHKMIDY